MRNRYVVTGLCACIALFMMAVGTQAQESEPSSSYGARIGVGVDPDQFVIGVQAVLGNIAKVARFAPNADIGFGDDVTAITVSGDVRLMLSPPKSATSLYAAVAPTLAYFDPKAGDGDTEVGISIAAGVQFPMGGSNFYNLEGRYGIGDIPEVRVLFGILFGGR